MRRSYFPSHFNWRNYLKEQISFNILVIGSHSMETLNNNNNNNKDDDPLLSKWNHIASKERTETSVCVCPKTIFLEVVIDAECIFRFTSERACSSQTMAHYGRQKQLRDTQILLYSTHTVLAKPPTPAPAPAPALVRVSRDRCFLTHRLWS